MAHTPGPWKRSGDLIVGPPEPRGNPKVEPYGHSVAKLCWDFDGDCGANGDLPWSIAEANGRIIIAAPKLLETCRLVLGSLEHNLAPEFLPETRIALREVISQATGEAP